jgi:hypothetical protein
MKVFLKKQKQFGKKQWLIEKKNACHYYKKKYPLNILKISRRSHLLTKQKLNENKIIS